MSATSRLPGAAVTVYGVLAALTRLPRSSAMTGDRPRRGRRASAPASSADWSPGRRRIDNLRASTTGQLGANDWRSARFVINRRQLASDAVSSPVGVPCRAQWTGRHDAKAVGVERVVERVRR
jgi:hypothetical protein